MKRTIFAALAILTLVASFAGPVGANGTMEGKEVTVILQDLPEKCPTGQSMVGEAIIILNDDGQKGTRLVSVNMSVVTPFGDVSVFQQTMRMERGTKAVVPLSIPVGTKVPTGDYYFDLSVSVKSEEVNVGHEVYIYTE